MKKEIEFNYYKKIENAIYITSEKIINEPNNPMYSYIEKLLISMRNIVNKNIKVPEENNIGNELGMLVVRRIDDEDPAYADILIEISDNFECNYVLDSNDCG